MSLFVEKWKQIKFFFSCLLKHFKEKAQQIKDAVIEAKRVATQQ